MQINGDILSRICRHCDHKDLPAMYLVSSETRSQAAPYLYQSITLSKRMQIIRLQHTLVQNRRLGFLVKRLTLLESAVNIVPRWKNKADLEDNSFNYICGDIDIITCFTGLALALPCLVYLSIEPSTLDVLLHADPRLAQLVVSMRIRREAGQRFQLYCIGGDPLTLRGPRDIDIPLLTKSNFIHWIRCFEAIEDDATRCSHALFPSPFMRVTRLPLLALYHLEWMGITLHHRVDRGNLHPAVLGRFDDAMRGLDSLALRIRKLYLNWLRLRLSWKEFKLSVLEELVRSHGFCEHQARRVFLGFQIAILAGFFLGLTVFYYVV